MPVKKCLKNKMWKIGNGPCIYKTKKKAEEAQRAMYAKRNKKIKEKYVYKI